MAGSGAGPGIHRIIVLFDYVSGDGIVGRGGGNTATTVFILIVVLGCVVVESRTGQCLPYCLIESYRRVEPHFTIGVHLIYTGVEGIAGKVARFGSEACLRVISVGGGFFFRTAVVHQIGVYHFLSDAETSPPTHRGRERTFADGFVEVRRVSSPYQFRIDRRYGFAGKDVRIRFERVYSVGSVRVGVIEIGVGSDSGGKLRCVVVFCIRIELVRSHIHHPFCGGSSYCPPAFVILLGDIMHTVGLAFPVAEIGAGNRPPVE